MSAMGKAARRNWKRVVELWQESGLSKVDFCRRNNIPERKFSYYSIKFKAFSAPGKSNSHPEKTRDSGFAKVVCRKSHPRPSGSLTLRLDCGASLEIGNDFNVEILRKILKAAASL